MIISQNLTGTQKMMYLKQNVHGEAGRLIMHLSLSNANFDVAWQSLNSRYNNERLIIAAILDKILNLNSVRNESAENIKNIHDFAIENLNALKTFQIDDAHMIGLIFHHILIKKLDANSHTLYEQSLADTKTIQTVEKLLEFLDKRFHALEAVGKKAHSTSEQSSKRKEKVVTAL